MGACASKPVQTPAESTTAAKASPGTDAASAPATKQPQQQASSPTPATKDKMAVKVYIVYYSMYGHIRTMAQAVKEGVESVEGVEAVLYRVAETLPAEVLEKMHAAPKAEDPVLDPHNLPDADAFFFGFPTRFGAMPAQFKAFMDATGQHWQKGALHGKPFSLFTSTATQNGGQETTMMASLSNFAHHGMIYVPAGYCCPGTQFDLTEVHGGSPWGPGCLAGPDGSRQPSAKELDFAKAAGKQLAAVAKKLKA